MHSVLSKIFWIHLFTFASLSVPATSYSALQVSPMVYLAQHLWVNHTLNKINESFISGLVDCLCLEAKNNGVNNQLRCNQSAMKESEAFETMEFSSGKFETKRMACQRALDRFIYQPIKQNMPDLRIEMATYNRHHFAEYTGAEHNLIMDLKPVHEAMSLPSFFSTRITPAVPEALSSEEQQTVKERHESDVRKFCSAFVKLNLKHISDALNFPEEQICALLTTKNFDENVVAGQKIDRKKLTQVRNNFRSFANYQRVKVNTKFKELYHRRLKIFPLAYFLKGAKPVFSEVLQGLQTMEKLAQERTLQTKKWIEDDKKMISDLLSETTKLPRQPSAESSIESLKNVIDLSTLQKWSAVFEPGEFHSYTQELLASTYSKESIQSSYESLRDEYANLKFNEKVDSFVILAGVLGFCVFNPAKFLCPALLGPSGMVMFAEMAVHTHNDKVKDFFSAMRLSYRRTDLQKIAESRNSTIFFSFVLPMGIYGAQGAFVVKNLVK